MFDPDVRVLAGSGVRATDWAIPASAVELVVEVSVTTQAHDRGPKPRYTPASLYILVV